MSEYRSFTFVLYFSILTFAYVTLQKRRVYYAPKHEQPNYCIVPVTVEWNLFLYIALHYYVFGDPLLDKS